MNRVGLLMVFLFCFLTLASEDVHAQRLPHYLRQSTISPYLNLYRGDSGGINNYFGLVRPMQNQQQFNQAQAVENRLLQQQILGNPSAIRQGMTMMPQGVVLQPELMGMPGQPGVAAGPSLRPSAIGIGQPAQAASYFNYLQFYNVPVVAGRRVR